MHFPGEYDPAAIGRPRRRAVRVVRALRLTIDQPHVVGAEVYGDNELLLAALPREHDGVSPRRPARRQGAASPCADLPEVPACAGYHIKPAETRRAASAEGDPPAVGRPHRLRDS